MERNALSASKKTNFLKILCKVDHIQAKEPSVMFSTRCAAGEGQGGQEPGEGERQHQEVHAADQGGPRDVLNESRFIIITEYTRQSRKNAPHHSCKDGIRRL